jgi:hypothetical protein
MVWLRHAIALTPGCDRPSRLSPLPRIPHRDPHEVSSGRHHEVNFSHDDLAKARIFARKVCQVQLTLEALKPWFAARSGGVFPQARGRDELNARRL